MCIFLPINKLFLSLLLTNILKPYFFFAKFWPSRWLLIILTSRIMADIWEHTLSLPEQSDVLQTSTGTIRQF